MNTRKHSLYIWEPILATCIHTLSVAHLSWLPRGEGCLWTLCCSRLKRNRHSCTYNHHHYATTSDTHCEPIITLHIEPIITLRTLESTPLKACTCIHVWYNIISLITKSQDKYVYIPVYSYVCLPHVCTGMQSYMYEKC